MNNDPVFDEKTFSDIEKELEGLVFTEEDERLFDELFKQIADYKGDMFVSKALRKNENKSITKA